MTIRILSLLVLSVSLSAIAQISLKHGMSSPKVTHLLDSGASGAILGAILKSPSVMGGLALYGIGAVVWLFVLARLDVTTAYPFVGLGFILTMILGAFFLGEILTPWKVVGTLLVTAGVILVAR